MTNEEYLRKKEERRQDLINNIAKMKKSYKIQCFCIAGQAISLVGLIILLIVEIMIAY